MTCEKEFVDKLHESGLRITPQREIILAVMHDLEGHATVERIHSLVQEQSAAIDVSTVYRTLELLQNLGLVASVDLDDGQSRYELLGHHGMHHHLYCRSCGRLIRVDHGELQSLLQDIEDRHGFQAEMEHFVIPGHCAACSQSQDG
jgi:Fur family ferric uptake transcriptional regulator